MKKVTFLPYVDSEHCQKETFLMGEEQLFSFEGTHLGLAVKKEKKGLQILAAILKKRLQIGDAAL